MGAIVQLPPRAATSPGRRAGSPVCDRERDGPVGSTQVYLSFPVERGPQRSTATRTSLRRWSCTTSWARVPHKDIRIAVAALHEYGDWPLTAADLGTLQTRGKTRLVAKKGDATYDVGERGWQRVVNPESTSQGFVLRLRKGGWAVRRLPDLEHIG